MNLSLLKKLCAVHAPSGNEEAMTTFLLEFIQKEKDNWMVQPEIFTGGDFQECIVLIFGKPATAVYAHIDNIGFTVRYNNELVKIGSPKIIPGTRLTGYDRDEKVEGDLVETEEGILKINHSKTISPGTDLSFSSAFREDENFVQSCYLDNRLGVYTALMLARELKNGAIVFSCREEHAGGSAGYIAGFLYEKYGIRQSLIGDITWITEGVRHGMGAVVSLRDSGIPRRKFINRIISVLNENNINYQVEVESSGGSDGNEIQRSPFPVDWCFIGAPEDFVHSPDEKVHKDDIRSMIEIYSVLMRSL